MPSTLLPVHPATRPPCYNLVRVFDFQANSLTGQKLALSIMTTCHGFKTGLSIASLNLNQWRVAVALKAQDSGLVRALLWLINSRTRGLTTLSDLDCG
ncbi:MAG: hypothetical protein AAGD09_24045 [Cyanobacteria bacterium P01_F01_bin.56]